jgi:hypothetical protein
MIGDEFKPAYANDHTRGIARPNEDSYLATAHNFETFLGNNREDLPRYSILSNYAQIMKIMHQNYLKSAERDAIYRNRDKKDLETDEDYAQYVDEQTNTRKMSNILRRINTPKKRTNLNYHYRQQIKDDLRKPSSFRESAASTELDMVRTRQQNAKADIQLKAMMFHKMRANDKRGGGTAGRTHRNATANIIADGSLVNKKKREEVSLNQDVPKTLNTQ